MEISPKIIIPALVSLTFICCSSSDKKTVEAIFHGDSLKIIVDSRGDTTIKEYVSLDTKINENHKDTIIYNTKEIDLSIAKSNFYFSAKGFRIYFDKQKVVAYCDSVLNDTSSNKNDEVHSNWSTIEGMKELKKTAQSDKKIEKVLVNWVSALLVRFDPLIIKDNTNETSKFLLTRKYLSKYAGDTRFFSIEKVGDTSFIWYWQDFNNFPLRQERQ